MNSIKKAGQQNPAADSGGGVPSSFYERGGGDNMGRDSPGALLDMLAEVASQTLHSEKKLDELDSAKKSGGRQQTREPKSRKTQQTVFDVNTLLSMPATQLVKLFSIFSSNELKRQYSYSCALVPGCGQSYTSFASEGRARMSIKSHLADHLEFLKNNADTYSSFTATAVKNAKVPKIALQANKKTKAVAPPTVPKNPRKLEIPNKENKVETKVVSEKASATRQRKSSQQQTQEVSFKELVDNDVGSNDNVIDLKEVYQSEMKRAEQSIDSKVLGDHSYYEHKKDQNNLQANAQSSSKKNSSDSSNDNSSKNEKIMLYIVDNDSGALKKMPDLDENFCKKVENGTESLTLWKGDNFNNGIDNYVPAKPKGKAKFIGTSKEEREMALVLIERIRKKGNPGGNNLQCRICDPPRTFTAPTTLVSHYRSHAGIKPYECRICRSVFTRRHSLKYHMLIHQNQTRFTCADCGKKFRHPSHFREHRRRHTGESPFGCEDCGQRFKTRNTYKRHLKTRHGKVLTINGELLHLSEEDSKKVRTKNRRKKADLTAETNAAVHHLTNDDLNIPDSSSTSQTTSAYYENGVESGAGGDPSVEQVIENGLWMYNNAEVEDEDVANSEDVAYSEILGAPVRMKTDVYTDETELESNFEGSEIIVAHTDADGGTVLTLKDYADYANEAVYEEGEETTNSNEFILPEEEEEEEDEDGNRMIKSEVMEEYGVLEEYGCEDEMLDEMVIAGNQEDDEDEDHLERKVVVVSEEPINGHDEDDDEGREEMVETNMDLTENLLSIPEYSEEGEEDQSVKMIPYQIKVCDSNGQMLQLLNNSQFTLKSLPQSLNLIQNGKQQTILLLASNDDENIMEFDGSSVVEAAAGKTIPVVAVPAE